MKQTITLCIALLISGSTSSFAQQRFNKVLGMPQAALAPVKGVDISIYQPDRRADEGWVVISDRANNPLFMADGKTPNGKKMKFREYAWVVEQQPEKTGELLHLVRASVTGTRINGQAEDLGWIHRSKVLLWKNGLRSSVTNIHQKAFTLNKLEDIKKILDSGQRDFLDIYAAPDANVKLGTKTIYEFYFVYKDEGDKYLLAKEASLGLGNLDQDLVGWVEKRRISDWQTRLALEPNFEELAFAERTSNAGYRLAAYGKSTQAANHATSARMGTPFWKADPVTLNSSTLIDRRFPGSVVRFPMLQNYGVDYCRTGVIGDIKMRSVGALLDSMEEILYSRIVEEKDRMIRAKQQFDLIFLVEGTAGMGDYRQTIMKIMESAQSYLPSDATIRTAAAIYRDEPAGEANLFQYTELSEQIGIATNFLNTAKFENFGDYDSWTSMYYGIQQSLLRCKTVKEHTTVLIVIGNYGDFSRNKARSDASKGKKTLIDREALVKTLADLNVNLFAIQPRYNNGLEAEAFTSQNRKLIEESAKAQHAIYRRLDKIADNLSLNSPTMPADENLSEYPLSGGSVAGSVRRASKGGTLSLDQMRNAIKTNMDAISMQHRKTEENLNRLLDDGAPINEISQGGIEGPLVAELLRIQQRLGLDEKDIYKLVKDKYKLYHEAYMPLQINGARYPAVSYVLFMPESDLREYIDVLHEVANAQSGSITDQRKALYTWMVRLAEKYGNLNSKSSNEIEDVKYEDLMNTYIQGIKDNSGFNLIREMGLPTNFAIGDLKSSRRFPDENVTQLIDRIVRNTRQLENIRQKGATYPFAYESSGLIYYWIPVKYTF